MLGLARLIWRQFRRWCFGSPFVRTRRSLAWQYLRGQGIEIGALHSPLAVRPGTRVLYVDRMPVDQLRQQYLDCADLPLVPVDIVDDGERLTRVRDTSQDFVIANHFLEHCQDPIGTLKQMFRVLRPGGVLYLAIPDKRYTFDAPRAVTSLAHLWEDHQRGPEHSRREHFEDFVRAVYDLSQPKDIGSMADQYQQADYSIHFHVWTQKEMLALLLELAVPLGYDFETVRKNDHEVIFILRKHLVQVAKPLPQRRAA